MWGGELKEPPTRYRKIQPLHARSPRGSRWFFLIGRQKYLIPVNKVISVRSHLRRTASDGPWMGRPASDPGFSDGACGRCAGPSAARWLMGLADPEARSWSVPRRRVAIGGGGHRPAALRRFAPWLGGFHLAWPGGRCHRGTGGAASRCSTRSAHVGRAAGELR
jgi:hypothetical protein